jgi:hypothetical protein
MRRSASLLIPLTLILIYYAFWVVATILLLRRYPVLSEYLPLGGVSDLAATDPGTFEPIYTRVERTLLAPTSPIRLLLASIGASLLRAGPGALISRFCRQS